MKTAEYLNLWMKEDSENYRLARACIDQGIEYYENEYAQTGISPIREAYMVSNFIDAYARCESETIMGIYGSYHVNLDNPDLMAGQLRAHYGEVISSVKTSSIAFGDNQPYRLGLCLTGLVFLLMLFIPNIIWGLKAKPEGFFCGWRHLF